VRRLNIPNTLTIARIAMAPLLALAMQRHDPTSAALLIFGAGMTSDAVDGYLARSRGWVTRFGTLMDPIADKLFIGTAFVCLAASDRIAVWVVAVVFARELFVTLMRLAARRQGMVIGASLLGKAKTVVQTVVVVVLLVAGGDTLVGYALVYLMVAITLVSGAAYATGYMRGRRAVALPVTRRATVSARARLG
jgi:CDP-diacylglycerol--glycerol-3-phosphate 3-phosphatidyltransferase